MSSKNTQPLEVVVAFGNPGDRYARTRHNAGVWMLDRLLSQYHASELKKVKYASARATTVQIDGRAIHMVTPTTYMNESGHAIGRYLRYHHLHPEQMLVLHDELDLPPGTIRLKASGGFGGHNGLKDLFNHLHTRDFRRVRIGIGHPGHADAVSGYVLSAPSPSDRQAIDQAIQDGLSLMPDMLRSVVDWQDVTQQLHTISNH